MGREVGGVFKKKKLKIKKKNVNPMECEEKRKHVLTVGS